MRWVLAGAYSMVIGAVFSDALFWMALGLTLAAALEVALEAHDAR